MFKSLQQFCAGHIVLGLPRDGLYHAQRSAVQGGPDGLVSHGAHSLDRRGHVQVPPATGRVIVDLRVNQVSGFIVL